MNATNRNAATENIVILHDTRTLVIRNGVMRVVTGAERTTELNRIAHTEVMMVSGERATFSVSAVR